MNNRTFFDASSTIEKDALMRAFGPHLPGSLGYTDGVRLFQVQHGLLCDGVAGPNTIRAVMVAEMGPPAPTAPSALAVGGKLVPTPSGLRVVRWDERGGMGFQKQAKTWAKRPTGAEARLFVLHHDVCRSSALCFNALDADGTVYQALDLKDAMAYHATWANPISVGVEINCPVTTDDGRGRPKLREWLPNGAKEWDRYGYTVEQLMAIPLLAHAVCDALGIPKRLPGVGPDVFRGAVARATMQRFSGVCGHYHVQVNKNDPGMSLWKPLIYSGFSVA